MSRTVHPIEAHSYAVLRSRVDTSGLAPLSRAVVERVVHATADLDYAEDLACDEDALVAGARALRAGVPLVVDAAMVAAGITSRSPVCRVGDPRAAELAQDYGATRSAAAMRVAYGEVGPGAVWAVGCAPTALEQIVTLGAAPALVVGVPVGFVGAVAAKRALRASGLPQLSNRSEKGGSAVAAATVNALLYEGLYEGLPEGPCAGVGA